MRVRGSCCKLGAWALAAACSAVVGCATFYQGPMPGEPANATFLQVEGARVRYVDTGKGPAVTLIHGFASALDTWNGVIPQLAKNHRVIALDLKGFGWTDRPPGDYSPRAEASLVWALLDARGVDKTAIVAHSWGSSVALAAVMLHPERVTRMALYDAWVYEEQLPTMFAWAREDAIGEILFSLFYKERPDEKLANAFYDKSLVTEQFAEEVERAMDRPGTVAAALAAVRGQNYERMEKHYPSIKQPVLLLWGREDTVTTLEMGERLSHDLPNSRMIVYPLCGHLPMIEAASASNRDLVQFLSADLAPPAPSKASRAPAPGPAPTPAPSTEEHAE